MAEIDFGQGFAAMPAPHMMLDRELRFVEMNESYHRITERTREGLLGRQVFDAFPEIGARRAVFADAFARALAGEPNRVVRPALRLAGPDGHGGRRSGRWGAPTSCWCAAAGTA